MAFSDEGGSWLGVETQEVTAEKAKELKLSTERGVLLEWAGHDLLAIDAADAEMSRTLADYLWAEELRGALVYETGDLVPR